MRENGLIEDSEAGRYFYDTIERIYEIDWVCFFFFNYYFMPKSPDHTHTLLTTVYLLDKPKIYIKTGKTNM